MAIYKLGESALQQLEDTTFQRESIYERNDLQRLLREQVEVIAPETMVVAEEFGYWEDSYRRIDLLGLDRGVNLVVIELKRNETGDHMELQDIRYAAMVSTMTFQQIVEAHRRYLRRLGREDTGAEDSIRQFLGWSEPRPEALTSDVRIVLVSAEFSRELTSAVLWLNERGLDIRCVRLRLYRLENQLLIDVQQVLPLPEIQEYQIRIREKSEEQRVARQSSLDFTRYDLTIGDRVVPRLYKRYLILEVVREAVSRGISPDAIEKATGVRNLWVSADGELDGSGFVEAVTEAMASTSRNFESFRYFTSDEQLIIFNGRTYALTNQWGKDNVFDAVERVVELIGASDIAYNSPD